MESSAKDIEAMIQTAYLKALSRYPTKMEMAALNDILSRTPDNEFQAAVEDMYWGIMTSREFLFCH